MTVFILLQTIDYEGDTVLEVFATKAAAETALAAYTDDELFSYSILEKEVL
jgi:hypothetical protein